MTRAEIKTSCAIQYLAGRRAFCEGKSPTHNPYAKGVHAMGAAGAWREGFADAACNTKSLVEVAA